MVAGARLTSCPVSLSCQHRHGGRCRQIRTQSSQSGVFETVFVVVMIYSGDCVKEKRCDMYVCTIVGR